jgi:hypothetical protein
LYEARVVLDNACKSFNKANPDIPLLTIDSILTTNEFKEVAGNSLKLFCESVVSFSAQVSIK